MSCQISTGESLLCELLPNQTEVTLLIEHLFIYRQFLFRHKDLGHSKAETAAKFINSRIPGANVIPHFCKIQDKDEEFYKNFHIIVCGLDSIVARRF